MNQVPDITKPETKDEESTREESILIIFELKSSWFSYLTSVYGRLFGHRLFDPYTHVSYVLVDRGEFLELCKDGFISQPIKAEEIDIQGLVEAGFLVVEVLLDSKDVDNFVYTVNSRPSDCISIWSNIKYLLILPLLWRLSQKAGGYMTKLVDEMKPGTFWYDKPRNTLKYNPPYTCTFPLRSVLSSLSHKRKPDIHIPESCINCLLELQD